MAGFTNYLEDEVLDHVLCQGAIYAFPSNVWVGLYTAAPNDDGGGTEVIGGSYARVSTSSATWNTAVDGSTDNAAAITFPQASASWGLVTHFGIFDAASSGNLLMWAILTASKTIDIGDTASFAIGDLDVTLD
jgi:hypothetical protein